MKTVYRYLHLGCLLVVLLQVEAFDFHFNSLSTDFHFPKFEFPEFDFGNPKKKEAEGEEELDGTQIPDETKPLFIDPEIPSPRVRDEKYTAESIRYPPPSATFAVKNVPFFETIDHGDIIMALQSFRLDLGIPFLRFESLRPNFPFYVHDKSMRLV